MFHIVEDTECLRELLAEIIETFGRSTMTFSGPLEYLEYARSNTYRKPSAVITDIRMPHMSGYKMMDEVKSIHPDVSFAVISGEQRVDHQYKDQVSMYIFKPFEGAQIESLVSNFKPRTS